MDIGKEAFTMKNWAGIYFSGSGNSRYCINRFMEQLIADKPTSIEKAGVMDIIENHDWLVLAYPTYYSCLPPILEAFISEHKDSFKNKKIFLIATMGLFSGDGTGCAARLLKQYGAEIIGGLHLKMPDCISDVRLLKHSAEENTKIIKAAEHKVNQVVKLLKEGEPTQEGLSKLSHLLGLFGQRLWFKHSLVKHASDIKIDHKKCIQCLRCVQYCPKQNLQLKDHKIQAFDQCTMCYRCINLCPKQAITLLGKKVYVQNSINSSYKKQ